MATIASLQRISAAQLAERLLGPGASTLAIVDVRDDDYIGGHIRGALHFPSGSLDATWPTLLRRLQGADTVIFHCALSQQRGPGAALRYLRALEQASGRCESATEMPQTVYVLDQGFTGWQEVYGEDERLTEGFRKELWRELWR